MVDVEGQPIGVAAREDGDLPQCFRWGERRLAEAVVGLELVGRPARSDLSSKGSMAAVVVTESAVSIR